MKPKYRTLKCFLPTAVSIAMSLPFAAQAGIFADDTGGNAQPTAVDNGANTIIADGGTSLTPFVTISAAVSMTGDIVNPETTVLEITGANYTVTNAGSLAGTNHSGIFANQTFTLTNNGTISGSAGWDGIRSTIATITNNTGDTITGGADGIHFTANGGSITNSGTISGTGGGTSDGIRGRDNLFVNNLNGGSISGVQHGVFADANIDLNNANNASITTTNGDGIHLTANGGTIDNNGSISGGTSGSSDGIRGRTGLTVNNNTNFFVIAISGGSITGEQYGIFADDDLTVTNQLLATITGDDSGIFAGNGGAITTNVNNSGTITGNNGDGVRGLDSFVVINNAGGVITGTNGTGVWLDDNATVTNNGTITGTNSGVRVSEGSTVTNTGTISGAIGIDAFGFGSTFNLTNSGTITGTGGTAIDGILGGGVDTYLLNSGSLVTGDIFLRSGSDSITMTKGAASSIVNGDIDGGTGTDTLNFDNGMTVAGGFTNRVTGNVSNFEEINKTSAGTAFIVGNVNSDTIDVTGGALYIVGTVAGTTGPESAISANNAEIGGTGTWDANIVLTNDAIISPGQINLPIATNVADSIGTLTVAGDVTLNSSSSYVWNVTPGAYNPGVSHDQIVLSGVGNVFTVNSGDFVISPTNVNAPLIDGNTIVVDTDEPLVGSFSSITLADFPDTTPDTGFFESDGSNNPILTEYFATLTQVNGGEDWRLTIVHDYSQFGSTPNEVAAGNLLDSLVTGATGDLADLFAAMDYSEEFFTSLVLAALDPGAQMAAAAGIANNNYNLHRTVEGHNAAVRSGFVDCDAETNIWGGFSYTWQDLNASTTGFVPFDQDGETSSFHAGVDCLVAENFRLGVVAQGSQTDWSGSAAATDVDSYRFAAYANWGAATGWFVDALIGYNTHDVDQNRFSGSGSYEADGWQGLVNVGYAVETAAGKFSPFVGLEWQQMDVDSFDSTFGPLPISVGNYDIESFRALAGVRWEGQISSTIKGYASAAYAFEMEDDASSATVSFGGGSYTATGMEQGDALLVSAGLRWSVTDCTMIDLGYNGEFAADDGVDSNSANLGVNFSF